MVMVYKVPMPDGCAARTDGVNIWVNEQLNDIETRCAVEHEMIHIERGEGTVQPEHIEMIVRYETARRLLPLDLIVGVCKNGKTLGQVATELGVTKRVLMDRAVTLSSGQAQIAGCFSCLKCPSVAARMADMPKMHHRVAIAA